MDMIYWFKRTMLVLGAIAAITIISTQTLAASGCKQVNGKFMLQPVSGPDCVSSVDICAIGSYSGAIKGSSAFTGTSLIPTVDTPTTAVVLLTGDNMIETKGGTLLTKDAIVLQTTGAREFAELDTITGGTGEWAGASGQLTATGTFNAATGGQGVYSGEVCVP